ncbi:YdeI/OmpD-associated family protein [Flagellimonas sp.]|uniref:YdeI/OmpD-associated family protein n=1 Tax=Flagellimonas sp. TaxID=2058762 RepID=UPI0034C1C843
MNPKVIDRFLDRAKKWNDEMRLLRKICLDCGLAEDFKWMHPCYTFQGKNIVLIHGFKEYCALLFHKGALLGDVENILVQQTENVQAARQIRFTSKQQIIELERTIKAYIFEAMEVEKSGAEVKMKKTSEFDVPEELQEKFNEDPDFETAFKKLTPGRQRGYLLHFSGAKQSKTRESRIEKCIPKIFKGKGLNDR